MDSIVGTAVFLLSILFLSKLLLDVAAAKKRKKNLPPSPPSLPIIGHLHILKKPVHPSLAKLSSLYGPVMSLRFGSRPVVVVSSSSAAEECFTTNDVAFANRPDLFVVKYFGANLVWSSYGPHWRTLRRISVQEIFSSHRLLTLSGMRKEEVRYFASRLHQHCGHKEFKKVEMRTRFYELVFNLTMRVLTGNRYFGGDARSVEVGKIFKGIMEDTFLSAGDVYLGDHLPWLRWLDFQGKEKRLAKLKTRRDTFLQSLIAERRATRASRRGGDEKGGGDESEEKGRSSAIDVFLKLQEEQPEFFKEEVVIGMGLDLLSAGIDTVLVGMEWALSLLVNHPEVTKRAREEIDSVLGSSKMIDESDVAQLPYLQAIVSEALRLHPPVPLLAPHESSEDTVIGGYHIPKGTMLFVNVWAIQRDEKWWEDAAKFKPERFLPTKGGGAVIEGCKSIPFGSGRRKCPGEGLAIKQLGLALGTMIQCFHWDKVGGVDVDMTDGEGLSSPKAVPLVVMCKTREEMLPFLS